MYKACSLGANSNSNLRIMEDIKAGIPVPQNADEDSTLQWQAAIAMALAALVVLHDALCHLLGGWEGLQI